MKDSTESDIDSSLVDIVREHVQEYFNTLAGQHPENHMYSQVMEEVSKVLIEEALKYNNFVLSKTARTLGINRNTLAKKIKDYKIQC
jgi:DNA-binding protein Fis